jgi:hypothetical protein
VGGAFEINDTGNEPGQFDVGITTEGGTSIALEVTSFGGEDWKRTGARVRAEQDRGNFAGEGLRQQWLVTFPSGIGIREIEAPLTEVLLRLEQEGIEGAERRYDGDDATLREVAEILGQLPVNSVFVFDPNPTEDEPRIFLAQSLSFRGGSGDLPAAITALFAKGDNQAKLARAECDERHLYVFMEDGGASAVLEGAWPLPACPPDPAEVIDTLWVYCPSVSGYLFRTRPGSEVWERFVTLTGDPA